jgi:hypothetical protein
VKVAKSSPRVKKPVPAAEPTRRLAKPNPKSAEEGDEADRDDDRLFRQREKRGEFISLEEFQRWWRDRSSR